MKYLFKILNQDFNDQKKKLDNEIKELQKENENIMFEVQSSQNIYDELKYEKDAKDKEFSKKVTSISTEISKIEEIIRKYEKEILLLNKNTKICEGEIIQLQDLQDKLLKEQEILKTEENETNEKINAIQQDIQQTEMVIDEIDKKMAEVNMRKKLMNDSSKEQYFSEDSVYEEDKRNVEVGSFMSRKDRESSVFNNNMNFGNNTSDQNNNVVYEENTNILVKIQKKKETTQDEDVKKIDKSCEICRVM